VVVVVDEVFEQCLELGDGGGLVGSGAEPAFEGLVEAFDFAAGGGVSGPGVLLVDAEAAEFGLEAVAAAAAAGEAGGEDHAVVGQGRGRGAVAGDSVAEHVDHGGAGDGLVGGDRDGVAGVVVNEAEDLGVGATVEPVVGEVGLPALVGELGREPHIGALGPLVRLGGDQSSAGQVAGDAGPGYLDAVVMVEVPADRVGTRIQTLVLEVLAPLDDPIDRGRRQRPR
jgi:hypothetical protein